jgi:hypothetical protein
MTTILKAPYPLTKTTSILPDALFLDARNTESTIQIKRTATRVISHPKTSDRETLTLPFRLSRMKSLELEAFHNAYKSTTWHVTLHDGSQWEAQPVGPLTRTAVDRTGWSSTAGKEVITLTLTLSAKRLN